jgi:hypothetical protein
MPIPILPPTRKERCRWCVNGRISGSRYRCPDCERGWVTICTGCDEYLSDCICQCETCREERRECSCSEGDDE